MEPFIGEIRLLPYTFAPNGWLDCDGSLLSIAQYSTLYALLGTTYGGDGQTTFALPDMRGRVPLHMGQGLGLRPYTLGMRDGTEQVTLMATQVPSHTHTMMATTLAANTTAPGNAVELGSLSGDTLYTNDTSGLTPLHVANTMVGTTGNNQPHDNCMPTLTVRYCICWAGVYPSPS